MMPRVSSAAFGTISAARTDAPCRARSTAVALPLPQPGPAEPAPVTIAALPSSLSMSVSDDPCAIRPKPRPSAPGQVMDVREEIVLPRSRPGLDDARPGQMLGHAHGVVGRG